MGLLTDIINLCTGVINILTVGVWNPHAPTSSYTSGVLPELGSRATAFTSSFKRQLLFLDKQLRNGHALTESLRQLLT